MFKLIKKVLPPSVKNFLKKGVNLYLRTLFYFKRKVWKIVNSLKTKKFDSRLSFAILCIKKTVYCDMTIDNANSLHILNPNHDFTIYCDSKCFDYLSSRINKFDYPKKIKFVNRHSDASEPWQIYKIDTLIEASKQNQILTDADGIWHSEPKIDPEKITLLVVAYDISSNKNESLLVEKVFNKKDWVNFKHYVTGFVSIPSKFMTEELESKLINYTREILTKDLDFIQNENVGGIRRLAEELAVNFSLQDTYSKDIFSTLKKTDGLNDKNSLQSLYYGCLNQIEN